MNNQKDIKKNENIYILGIETSCDETSASIVKDGREVISLVINSQIEEHKKYGGVVPEIASRMHVEAISFVVKESLKQANMDFSKIDGIAVTQGPGLVGALLVGLSYAKGLAYSLRKPIIGVNHLEGHIAANYITHKELKPPYISLIISGGHTHLVYVKGYTEYEILGKTRDDAVGEAFDKIARVMGLGYPGGPKIQKLAEEGKNSIELPIPNVDGLDFSFSGIKTHIINMLNNKKDVNKADLSYSFQELASDILIDRAKEASNQVGSKKIAVSGGVSANTHIKRRFESLEEEGYEIYFPKNILSTDNAAMIASQGYFKYLEKFGKVKVENYKFTEDELKLNAIPSLKIKCNKGDIN